MATKPARIVVTPDPPVTTSYSPEQAADLEAKDARYVMRPWTHPEGEPVIVATARDCVITDVHGKEFLDFTAGYFVNNAGHCHPRILEAATRQMGQVLQVSGKHGTVAAIQLAEKLVNLAPKTIDKAFFSTGGSEATEFALKMARQYRKQPKIAYLENAYHGLTLGSLAACASEKYRDSAGVPLGDHTYQIPNAYCYRCKFGPAATCKVECLDGVDGKLAAHPDTAAVLAETVQSVGGIAPPQKWWDRLDRIRKARGVLLVLDEIQTGLGRTGKMFAFEHYGLEPEIMTGGKGLSGGVGSLGVTCAGDAMVENFFGGTTPTSGGNAVSAAAGVAMIDTILDEKLMDNATAMGRYFTEAAWALADPWIGDVRFLGLLGGIELVADRDTKAVLGKKEMARIKDQLHAAGMLITVSGLHGNVLRLQPPLTITRAHIDRLLAALRQVLAAVRQDSR